MVVPSDPRFERDPPREIRERSPTAVERELVFLITFQSARCVQGDKIGGERITEFSEVANALLIFARNGECHSAEGSPPSRTPDRTTGTLAV